MKKFSYFVLFTLIFTIIYSSPLFAESNGNEILIKTIDNSEATEIFKD